MIACIALGALAAAGPATAGSGTLRVDDDKLQCPEAQFASIQAAVAAAEPGDKVKVCPGLYNEIVTVPKTLELDGAGPDPRERTGDPTEEAVVLSFNLQSSRIVLEGFTIQGVGFPSFSSSIVTSPLFSGYQIERNLVRTGLHLMTSGVEVTRVRHNAFISDFTASSINCTGCPRSRIEQNLVAGGFIRVSRTADVDIDRNSVGRSSTNSSSGISLVFVTDALVRHNRVEDGFLIGIDLLLVTNVEVTHNRVERSVTSNFFGFRSGAIRAAASSSLVIAHNTVVDGLGDGPGIRLENTSGIQVVDNKLEGNRGDGIFLDNADGNLIAHNKSDENGRDGIRANSFSTGNTIERNHMRRNVEHDCHDDSVGPNNPPALVANIWLDNVGLTENRPGLCRGNDD